MLRLLGAGVGLSGVFTRGEAGSSPVAAGSPSVGAAAAGSAVPAAPASSGGTGFSGSPVERKKKAIVICIPGDCRLQAVQVQLY